MSIKDYLRDIKGYKIGQCDQCKMVGILTQKAIVPSQGAVFDPNAAKREDALPILAVCLTCLNTPSGYVSENQIHEKLPAEEYLNA